MERSKTSCMVLHAVGASVQSMLGPNKSVKMYMSEGEGGGGENGGRLIGDSMQVLTALAEQIQHPAGHVILSSALSQHHRHGCGVASLVCLAAAWSREMTDLQEKQGVPLPAVFSVFEEALDLCDSIIPSLSLPLAQLHDLWYWRKCSTAESKALPYSRNFKLRRGGCGWSAGDERSEAFLQHLGGRLSHGRRRAMSLAVKAILPQVTLHSDARPLDISLVLSLPLVGVASQHSRVVEGVVCKLRHNMVNTVQHSEDTALRTIVLCGDVVEDYTHAGLKGDVKLSASLWSCDPRLESHDYRMKSHDPWLQTWCDLLTEHSVGLLAAEGTVSHTLHDFCLSRGIIILSQLPAGHTRALCRVTGARGVSYASQIRDDSVVGMARVGVVVGGWARQRVRQARDRGQIGGESADCYCTVKSAVSDGCCGITTAILCGHTHSQTDILQCSLRNCLGRLRCVMSENVHLVKGGGWVEARVAQVIRENEGSEWNKSLGTSREFRETMEADDVRSHTACRDSIPGSDVRSHTACRDSIPRCMRASWLGDGVCWSGVERRAVLNGFVAGLEHFAAVVQRNCCLGGLTLVQVTSEAPHEQPEGPGAGEDLSDPLHVETGDTSIEQDGDGVKCDVLGDGDGVKCDVLGDGDGVKCDVLGDGDGVKCDVLGDGAGVKCDVLDSSGCKMAVWRNAYRLARTLLSMGDVLQ